MAKKDSFERSLLVALLVLCFNTVLVTGFLYKNNLRRYGTHVCEDTKHRSYTQSITSSYVGYTTYYRKCGFLWLKRCKRSRRKTIYYTRDVIRYAADTYLRCCTGWQRNGDICTIPICNSGCNNGGRCVAPNSCSCTSGWEGSSCSQDINECLSNNGGCQQICINRIGTRNLCSCRRGYRTNSRDTKKCTDINECNVGNVCKCASGSNEDCGAVCTNTVGSYRCSCGNGYRLVGSSTCVDINECASNKGGCLHQCINTPGSYRCVCRRGFRMVNNKCQDVNECENSNGFCEHICQNVIGRHRCTCRKGLLLDRNGRTCSDMDECSVFHGCKHQCHNVIGGYYCSCTKGYELEKNNKTCTDVDECVLRDISGTNKTASLADCQQKCINNEGSFTCACNEGFQLMYDKKRCQDKDECKQHLCEQECDNTYGSYRCSCRPGFKLGANRRTCEGLPCEQIVSPRHGEITCSGLVTNSTCTFSCSPGYNLVGSQSRTCQAFSRWSGNRTSCEAKHCEELTPRIAGQSISVPCFTSFGSKCQFGCGPGFFLKGDGQANCSLSPTGSVSWKIGQFICEEIQICKPNPCGHGGNCSVVDEKHFTCDCEGTGYKGDQCQTGFITTPIFKKLRPKTKSTLLSVAARPVNKLRISLYSDKEITIKPSSSLYIEPPSTKQDFTVEAEKPGIRTISYNVEGPNSVDFDTPEESVLFVGPKISKSESLYTKLFLLKKELPIGCEEHKTNAFGCEVRLISTAPWSANPLATHGIVHIARHSDGYLPLSLIGLSFEELQLSRTKMTETSITITSSDKEIEISYLNSGGCSTKKAHPDNLLELMDADALAASFLQSFSKMSPKWLQFVLGESSDIFDIQNVLVSVANSPPLGSEHCSGFPVESTSSVAYFSPVINYNLFVGQDEVSLLADGKTCFLVTVCKPAVFFKLPRNPAIQLKNTLRVFRDMKQRGLDLRVNSIGLLGDVETTDTVAEGLFWNGTNLERTSSSVSYNMWLNADVEWNMQIPGKLKLTLQMTGQSFVYYDSLNTLFDDRFTRSLKISLKGKTSVTVTARSLGEDFTLKIKALKGNGKAFLGGTSDCKDNFQGISLTLETSARNLFLNSPFAPYIRPVKDQHVYLAVFMLVRGGKQNQVTNKREMPRTLINLRFLVVQLVQALQNAKSFLPEEEGTLDKWLKLSEHFSESIREILRVLSMGQNMDLQRLHQLVSDIDSKIYDSDKIAELLKNSLASQANNSAVADLITTIEGVQFGFPSSLKLPIDFGGPMVQLNFQGISFHVLTSLCFQKLCFDQINATVEFLKERRCVSSPFPLSTFKVRGKASRVLSLSPGKILTMFGGQTVDMVFESNSKRVSVLFEARLRLLGFNQFINVTMDETQLSFQADADIFKQFPTEMSVTAKVKRDQQWNSLVFSVNGKMPKSSLLPSLLENKIKETIHALAEKAARSIRNAENAVYSAKRRTEEAKNELAKKRNRLNIASNELTKKEFELNETRSAYSQAKLSLNSTLMRYIALKQRSACDLQNCSYIYTNSCIPKVCRKNATAKYPVSNCRGVLKTVRVEVIVHKEVKDFYWEPTFTTIRRGNCRSRGWFKKAFVGCDSYLETRPGPKKKVSYTRFLNARQSKKQKITVFECGKPKMKSVFSGYGRPYECCSNTNTAKVRVLEPQCVIHNTECFQNMTDLADDLKSENYTLFEKFQDMMRKGEMVTLVQLSVNKAQAKVDFESNQLELVSAFHKQQEYAEDSVNVSRVKSREELGLRLGEKMNNLGVQSLVSVEGLSFSIAMTSTMKTLFPLVASLKTVDGQDRTIEFPFDFNKVESSLTSGAERIIETLYGTSGSRKRRSTLEEPHKSVLENLDLAQEQRTCLFVQKANVFFADIIESLEFIVGSTKELDKELMESIHDFDKLVYAPNGAQHSGDKSGESQSTAASQQLRTAFSDMILSIKETQVNSSSRTPWNTTLEHWRGYLDVITQENNFTQCSGTKDCVDYFFSTLGDLYEFETNPRAIEIRQLLQELEEIIDDLLKQNHPLDTTEEIISRAKFVVNRSNDEIILCGLPPVIMKSSPQKVFVLQGDSAELTCEVRSTTEVDYLWTKNGRVIEDYKQSTLVFQNVSIQDEGVYRCQVSNNRGHATSNVTMVVVHRKPTITEHPRDLHVLEGSETASMICNCTGSPPPLTEWFFTPMANQSDQAKSLHCTEPVLILSNLTVEHAGFYYCNATNLHGQVQSKIAKLEVLRFTPGIPRVSVAMKFAQCVAGELLEETSSNCSEIPSSRLNNSNAFNYTFKEIIREMNWSPRRIDAFTHGPSPDASISFVVNGYEPIIPHVGASRYLKAMDAFSLSQRGLAIDLQSLQSALKAGKIKYHWHNVAIVGKLGSLEATVLTQKCPVGKEAQKDGFLCTDCIPGSYGLRNGTCLPCPDGQYQPHRGSTECLKCPYESVSSESSLIYRTRCIHTPTPCNGSQIPLIDRINLPISTAELYRSGGHLTFSCKPGYKMKGNATVVCNNGNWTFGEFRCERTCTPPWTELNKRCYTVMNVTKSGRWKDAFGKCRSQWSTMAIISSQMENDFVANLAKSQIHSTEMVRMWLGLRKVNERAVFKWGDDSSSDNYTNWSPGEPSNVKGRELCTEMLITGNYELHKWNDIDCEDQQPKTITVCEKALIVP